MRQFFGKYRGMVLDNDDPLHLGRVRVSVPAVFGEGQDSWAMPCVPFAGKGVGWYVIPDEGAQVWVEFEGGDPNRPIWTGCFWGDDELPTDSAPAKTKVLRWADGMTLTAIVESGSKKLTLEVGDSLKLVFDSHGIELSNGQMSVKLESSKVSVNSGALEVV